MSIEEIIIEALKEDIGAGDYSSLSSIPENSHGKMKLMVKEKGVIAGLLYAPLIIQLVDPNIEITTFMSDGTEVNVGDIAFNISGSTRNMLAVERTLLNFLQRLSGIATTTREYVNLIKGTHATILDTRKTTPNMRVFEKYAVKVGGGENHRFGLYDMIMLKDNHIDFAGGIEKAIDMTHQYLKENNLNLKIEIETRNLSEVERVLAKQGVDRIMLDNFTPDLLAKAIQLIDRQYETEASGGITKATIRQFAETGVDFISVGALTHHISSLDLSLKYC